MTCFATPLPLVRRPLRVTRGGHPITVLRPRDESAERERTWTEPRGASGGGADVPDLDQPR